MNLGYKSNVADLPVIAQQVTPQNAGLAGGTTVITMKGETLVDDLKVGDRIVTRDTGMSVLREIRTATVTMTPISIKAGSLGHTRPERDVVIGPETLVHIRDWRAKALFSTDVATIEAKRLVDGEFVSEQGTTTMTTYELVFDRQHIIYADGLEVVSAEA